jgi:guanosine-3',5'-bis(diphosphate) 3'-pyrophosphohydrolase
LGVAAKPGYGTMGLVWLAAMNDGRSSDLAAMADLLRAARFAAEKHRGQRRKDSDSTPYINHPVAVAELLAGVGKVTNLAALQAALLHDTLEDTATTPGELERLFGAEVRALVEEVTDDKSLPQYERKRLQAAHAPLLSPFAKQIKIADKTCNIGDISSDQPANWPLARKREYLDWAEQVVAGCRGCNAALEARFDEVLNARRAALG